MILGAEDRVVPSATSAARLADVPGVDVRVLEGKGHGLSGPDGGVDPDVLDRVADGILAVAPAGAGDLHPVP